MHRSHGMLNRFVGKLGIERGVTLEEGVHYGIHCVVTYHAPSLTETIFIGHQQAGLAVFLKEGLYEVGVDLGINQVEKRMLGPVGVPK